MPPIISVTTAQVTLNYTGPVFESGGGATVVGFTRAAAWSSGFLEDLCDAVIDSWVTNLNTATTEHVTLSSVRAITDSFSAEVSAGEPGTITTDTTPPNTALLVNYNTAFRGRRGRGRSFFPGMTFENTTDDMGNIDAAWRTSLQTSIDNFFDQIETSQTVQQVVIQNSEGNSPPLTPPPVVVSRVVDGRVTTQRRRLRR